MKVRYERGALSDLADIFSYIAADDRGAAARLVARLEAVVETLGANPRMGNVTGRARFRKIPVGNFLIVYELGKDEVVILYVRHGARRRPWAGEA
jgi:toxin ParE1/3/4